ncbi:MAG TPA: RNase H family protein [Pirellulales bacterium]|nr:RNase H family protein [Pirellulales bacterium]
MFSSYSSSRMAEIRPEDVGRHEGAARDFLDRYRCCVLQAATPGSAKLQDLLPRLLGWIADERNLYAAWKHLAAKAGGPGPNGDAFHNFSDDRVWEQLRSLKHAVETGEYSPGDELDIKIPKGPGRGFRTIAIRNIQDRVVERAITQIIQPLLDPRFHKHSFGGRPGVGPWHALALAQALAETQQRLLWITDDIRDAFSNVPLARLLDVVRQRLPDEQLLKLISRVVAGKRGLRQGSPLSTLLMNLYLDHFLDRPWARRHPTSPLLRYIDDLLVLCQAGDDARNLYADLRRRLESAAMPLKGNSEASICDLAAGQNAHWLGFDVMKAGDGGVQFKLPGGGTSCTDRWQDELNTRLLQAQSRADAPRMAVRIIHGFVEAMGPAAEHLDRRRIYDRIAIAAKDCGFEEIPEFFTFTQRLQSAKRRWNKTLKNARRNLVANGDSQHLGRRPVAFEAANDLEPATAASGPRPSFVIYSDGCCLQVRRRGGWAFQIKDMRGSLILRQRGGLHRTTNNRAELWAVIKALEWLPTACTATIVSDSLYVIDGIAKYLARWRAQNWRVGSDRNKRPLKNRDLWERLDVLLAPHTVSCRWIEGHAGQRENEECDRMARRSAKRTSRPTALSDYR